MSFFVISENGIRPLVEGEVLNGESVFRSSDLNKSKPVNIYSKMYGQVFTTSNSTQYDSIRKQFLEMANGDKFIRINSKLEREYGDLELAYSGKRIFVLDVNAFLSSLLEKPCLVEHISSRIFKKTRLAEVLGEGLIRIDNETYYIG